MTEIEALAILNRDDDDMRKGYFCLNDFEAIEVGKKALEEISLYKQCGLCLIPADIYKKQCEKLDELEEKQIAKKPLGGTVSRDMACYCPICMNFVCFRDTHKSNYCSTCGQKLDWGNEDAE